MSLNSGAGVSRVQGEEYASALLCSEWPSNGTILPAQGEYASGLEFELGLPEWTLLSVLGFGEGNNRTWDRNIQYHFGS